MVVSQVEHFVFCKESCWHGYSHLLLPIKVTYFECLNALFSKKRYCSSLCAWHSSKVLQVLYKKLSCRLLSSGPLAKLLKLLEFYWFCSAIVPLTMETNGGTLPSCWLCIIVLRCVTQMNGSELSPACSDGCQFLGHCSEICDWAEW